MMVSKYDASRILKETKRSIQKNKATESPQKPSGAPVDTKSLGGKQVVSQKPVARERASERKKASAEPGTVQIRDFPRDVMQTIRDLMPEADSNKEALIAFALFALSSLQQPVEVGHLTPRMKDVIASYRGDESLAVMDNRLDGIDRTLRELRELQESTLALSGYLTFDRLGFRQKNYADVSQVDFAEQGVGELIERARAQRGVAQKTPRPPVR